MTISGRLNYMMLYIEHGKVFVEFMPFLNIFDTEGRYCGRRNLIPTPKKPNEKFSRPPGFAYDDDDLKW